eukprot:2990086-Pleurochrysis_carterae.AAC.1
MRVGQALGAAAHVARGSAPGLRLACPCPHRREQLRGLTAVAMPMSIHGLISQIALSCDTEHDSHALFIA